MSDVDLYRIEDRAASHRISAWQYLAKHDVPALVAEVRALRAKVERVEAFRGELAENKWADWTAGDVALELDNALEDQS